MTVRGLFYLHIMKTGGTAHLHRWNKFADGPTYPTFGGGEAMEEKISPERFIDLGDQRRGELVLISAHMPAWTIDLAPEHLHVTTLREPVARTISHLKHIEGVPGTPDTVEEIWNHPGFRSRLRNYQTQFFADTQERHQARTERRRRLLEEDGAALDEFVGALQERLLMGLEVPEVLESLTTAIAEPTTLGAVDLERAKSRLERFDIVGVTERHGAFASRVAAAAGWSADPVATKNVTRASSFVGERLRREIAEETELDLALWEHARSLADPA